MATCPNCRTRYANDVQSCAADGEALLPDEAFSGVDPELQAGDAVGEYRIERKIGEGGFGAVYRAVHPVIGKTAAIKVLNRQYSSNPQMVSRFIAEARSVNQIRHRNIIDIFSFGALPDGRQYFIMELLEGMPFDRFLETKGRLFPHEALPILRAVARALDAAHGHGIVHRDLKPENIFLVFDEDGGVQPKLLDFGIAKLMSEGPSGGHKTRTGTPMGTPNYMSPEQCRGQSVGHRTDIYSYGVVCYQVLTGKLPFDGEGVMDILVKHMSMPAPTMSSQCPDLKPELDAPVLRMLEKNPDARPATVGAAVEELIQAARHAGYSVPPTAVVSGPSLPRSSGPFSEPGQSRPSNLTPAQMALAQAKTMAQPGDDALNKTLLPAATDVLPRPRRTMLVAGSVAAALVAAGLAVFFLVAKPGATAAGAGAASTTVATTPASAPSTPSAGVAVTPPSAPIAPIATTSVATPVDPAEIELRVDSTPPGVSVFAAGKKLGSAPGPIQLPFGKEKVVLTFKADGFASGSAEVVPSENRKVLVTLTRTQGAATGTRINPDLEKPVW